MSRASLAPDRRFALAAALAFLTLGVLASSLEALVVLCLLAVLVLRETVGRALDLAARARVDLLAGVGFVAFAVIVVRRVVAILSS